MVFVHVTYCFTSFFYKTRERARMRQLKKMRIHILKILSQCVDEKNLIIHSLKAQYCVDFYTTVILSVFALTVFLSLISHSLENLPTTYLYVRRPKNQ